jgi:hypothetical protein
VTVDAVVGLAKECYAIPRNLAGGNLHVVLDDENCDSESVHRALELAQREGDRAMPRESTLRESFCR